MIPQHGNFYERAIPNCALGDDLMLGSITLLLTDLGLMGDLNTSQRILAADSKYPVRFGSKCYGIKPRIRFPVSGIVLTTLGDLIASLYEPKPNDLGMEIFDAWIKSIRPEVAEVQPEPC
jgi:hypothetical protein